MNMTRLMRWGAIGVIGTALIAFVPGSAGSDSGPFVTGSGNAYAQFVRVGPTAARLSLAPTVGLSLADYSGTVGRGEATEADLAAIGVAQPCEAAQIPTVRVKSTDKDSSKGTTLFFAGSRDASGNGGGAGELFARATTSPFGESSFRLGSFSIPGLLTVGEGFAHSTAGVVGGNVRRATATVEISSFDFGGGALKLGGLRWDAVQETTDKTKKMTAKFTVQDASAGGVPLPLPVGGSDMASVLGPLNAAIAQTGFALRPPKNESLSGVAAMSPLSIEIINSPLGRQFLAPVLAGVQPIREPLADSLIPILKAPHDATTTGSGCDAAPSAPDLSVAVLVTDLSLGILAGSADFHLELGGVNAYTEGQRFTNPFLNNLKNAPVVTAAVETVVKPGSAGTLGSPAIPGTAGGDTAQLTTALPPLPKTIPGHKGGDAVAVGAIGLGAAILLAAADWYRMRSLHRAAG
jgi:hypothetical protein